jgi:DNA polymerase III epsilon subunit-like protein
MERTATTYSSDALPRISRRDAERRHLLDEETLARLHLVPGGAPVACTVLADGTTVFYFNPDTVKAAPPAEQRERKNRPPRGEGEGEPAEGELRRISGRRAELLGYFPAEALARAYYEPTEPPVACTVRKNGTVVPLYDKATCRRLPLPCTKCGATPRYRAKLCRSCYSAEIAQRRAIGDVKRAKKYGMSPDKVLFFDLELTGVFERDEVLSVSIINGRGEEIFESLIRPVRNKRWKRTEKIHGITPEMVKDSPTMEEVSPRLREILDGADRLIAYGTATDYTHLRRIYDTRGEREKLRAKLLDCAAEFSHFVIENELELTHHSLTDAMAHFKLDWGGAAHTSAADTRACRSVFETLYPHFYESEAE